MHPIGKDNSDQCSLAQNDEASRKSDVEKDGDSMKSSVVSSLSCSSSAVKMLPQENSCGPQQLPASAENGCSGMFQKIHGGSGSHVKKARDMFEQSSASAKPPTPPKPDFVQKPRYDTNLMKNLLSLSGFKHTVKKNCTTFSAFYDNLEKLLYDLRIYLKIVYG